MARPRKTGLDYFPFDVDFFDDEKIVAIAGEYGIKGEITAVKLLCAIYRNGYFIEWSEFMQMKMLKSLPGVSAELLNQIVIRLVKWNFFDKNLFDSAKVLSSSGIQRRFFQGVRRRSPSMDMPYILVSDGNNGVFDSNNPIPTEFLTSKMPQSKVKKNKKSTDVDKKGPATSASSINEELDILKNDESWLGQLQILHSIDNNTLLERLSEFKSQCIADGKHCHLSIQDAKKHFNSWLRIMSGKNIDNKNTKGGGRAPTMAERDAERERKKAEREAHDATAITFEEYMRMRSAELTTSPLTPQSRSDSSPKTGEH